MPSDHSHLNTFIEFVPAGASVVLSVLASDACCSREVVGALVVISVVPRIVVVRLVVFLFPVFDDSLFVFQKLIVV